MADRSVRAEPYQARQCPECKEWIFTDAAPFGEDDRTKTMRDALHWERHHPSDPDATVIGFPFFNFNDEPVDAVLEEVPDR